MVHCVIPRSAPWFGAFGSQWPIGMLAMSWSSMTGARRRRHAERHHQDGDQKQELCKHRPHRRSITVHIPIIQSAIPIIIRFSVRLMKPSGTLLDPPTHAHFSSRLSI